MLIVLGGVLFGQASDKVDCTPRLDRTVKASREIRANNDAKFGGYKRSPIVSFEVDEQGKIQNVTIKRRSGSAAADDLALNFVRHWKYKPRPGCGTLESHALVTIDFTAPPDSNP